MGLRRRRRSMRRARKSLRNTEGAAAPGGATASVVERLDKYGDRIMEALTEGQQTLNSIAHYELIEELGEGGMGTVFLAHHVSEGGIRKEVAIKVLKDTHDQSVLQKFIDEAELLAQLSQGAVVELLALESMEIALPTKGKRRMPGTSQPPKKKLYFMVQEYVNGPGLDHIMRALQDNRFLMHPAIVGFIMNKTVIALEEAHNLTDEADQPLNLVHRDISPSNILFHRRSGITKLADFGIAKAFTNDSLDSGGKKKIVGKPRYMSPEQLDGQAIPASDIWALGVIGYEALTGFTPYRLFGSTLNQQVNNMKKQFAQTLRHPKDILSATEGHYSIVELSDSIMLCLSQMPGQRPTGTELSALLESRFLYARGLGPTNKTLAAYINLLDCSVGGGEIIPEDGFEDSDDARTLKKTLWLDSPLGSFPKRLTKVYQEDFVEAIKAKEANPCLLATDGEKFQPDEFI